MTHRAAEALVNYTNFCWLLAAYFNVLFAINSVAHPGARRLLEQAERLCPLRPSNLAGDVSELLRLSAAADLALLPVLDRLVDGLERLTNIDK